MTLQNPKTTDREDFASIKELSGKLIERRRRRDKIPQARLAQKTGRSERWVREIEAGAATSRFEDHIRCAHALAMTTPHLFIPILAMEHQMTVPRELLLQDDLWELECELLDVVVRHQNRITSRLSAQAGLGRPGER